MAMVSETTTRPNNGSDHQVSHLAGDRERFEAAALQDEDFKEYTSWICNETYPDIEQHEQAKTTASSAVYPIFQRGKPGQAKEMAWPKIF